MRKPEPSALVCRQPVAVSTVAADTILTTNRAPRWTLVVKNDSATANVTAISIRRYPVKGGDPTEWEALSIGIPVAPGTPWTLPPNTEEDCEAIELRLTADADGEVYLTLGGS